jgi:crotonobetainyl-CoA:carnitine CoA-transferase CaiB-like acyl-CoA transferase
MMNTTLPNEADQSPRSRPLQGIRVVDLTRFISGPYCAMYLGDLGASIIKVEHPTQGDGTRRWGSGPHPADNPYYLSVNRNKRSLGLDIKSPGGQAILEALLSRSDVLITNSIPGSLEEIGLTEARLEHLNPGLVHCQITGYGDHGPARQRGAFDFTIQAESGLMSIVGDPEGKPTKVGAPIMDVLTGMNACIALLAALVQKRSGRTVRKVATSMLETALASMPNIVSDYLVGGLIPERYGNAHPNLAPYEIYETMDRWLALGLGNEPQWQRLCEILERPDLCDDPRFSTNVKRTQHRDELNLVLRPLFRQHTLAWWIDVLDSSAIPCAAVNTVPQALSGAQATSLGLVQEIAHPLYGKMPLIRSPLSLDGQALSAYLPPPRLGEHTDEILRELLGLDDIELATLREQGVIGKKLL